jgi:hypothetical protein
MTQAAACFSAVSCQTFARHTTSYVPSAPPLERVKSNPRKTEFNFMLDRLFVYLSTWVREQQALVTTNRIKCSTLWAQMFVQQKISKWPAASFTQIYTVQYLWERRWSEKFHMTGRLICADLQYGAKKYDRPPRLGRFISVRAVRELKISNDRPPCLADLQYIHYSRYCTVQYDDDRNYMSKNSNDRQICSNSFCLDWTDPAGPTLFDRSHSLYIDQSFPRVIKKIGAYPPSIPTRVRFHYLAVSNTTIVVVRIDPPSVFHCYRWTLLDLVRGLWGRGRCDKSHSRSQPKLTRFPACISSAVHYFC